MHLVNQSRLKILPDRGYAAAKADVLTIGRVDGALERRVQPIGDKVEGRTPTHGERWPRVVGEDEDRGVVRRCLTPPSFPTIVGPGSSDRPEHVSPHNPRTDIGESARRELLEETGYAAGTIEDLGPTLPDTGRLGNRIYTCFASGVRRVPESTPEEGIEVLTWSVDELSRAIKDGTFDHSLHVAGVLIAILHGRLRLPGL